MKKLTAFVLAAMTLAAVAAASEATSGTVTAEVLRVRSGAGTEAEIIGLLYEGDEVTISGQEGDWYIVAYDGGTGYLLSEHVQTAADLAAETLAALKADVVNKACEYLGARYVYGGMSPSGFDCSGFTSYVYRQFGYQLPRTASGQLGAGAAVEEGDLQMGDLVFFRDRSITSKAASHVGIYIGGGQFVHAASSRTGYVKISSLDESYFSRHYIGARRFITA